MHEFGVTQAAFEATLERAEASAASTITDVHLTIGVVSSIEQESILMYWAEIAQGTIAEHAALHFRYVPVECRCTDCGQTFAVESHLYPCPSCGSEQVHAIDDEYLALEAIDIEKMTAESVSE